MLVPMQLGEKIKHLMERRGWGPTDVAREVSSHGPVVRYQSIQQLLDKPDTSPRYILQLAAAFGFTVEQLAKWEPSKPEPATLQRDPSLRSIVLWHDPAELPPDQYVFFPRLEMKLSAGRPGHAAEPEARDIGASFRADYAARKGWRPSTHFTMRADGDSMEPTIQNNAPVVIATNDTVVKSGRIYALRFRGDVNTEPCLKRLDKLPGARLRIRSDNPDPAYAAYEVVESEIEVIGRAVWTPIEL